MATETSSVSEEIVDNLKQQISEIDLLQAMYPGDIILPQKNLAEFNNFIKHETLYIPENLDFIINLCENDLKFELFINLPLSYPTEEPDIFVRCNKFNRLQEKSLNLKLLEYIKNNHIGEVCIYTAITWLQENIDTFAIKETSLDEQLSDNNVQSVGGKFTRFWIYSHHIYNKKKREEIQKLAKALQLTGFCLSGKPGVICIEGDENACNEWWREIKSMCWKKIMIRKTETFEATDESSERKFVNFQELNFASASNSKHTNMSEFSKFMSINNFTHIFNDFFGLCND